MVVSVGSWTGCMRAPTRRSKTTIITIRFGDDRMAELRPDLDPWDTMNRLSILFFFVFFFQKKTKSPWPAFRVTMCLVCHEIELTVESISLHSFITTPPHSIGSPKRWGTTRRQPLNRDRGPRPAATAPSSPGVPRRSRLLPAILSSIRCWWPSCLPGTSLRCCWCPRMCRGQPPWR